MADWQPIETVPKDGEGVILYFECATVPVVHIPYYRSGNQWDDYKYRTHTDWLLLPEFPNG